MGDIKQIGSLQLAEDAAFQRKDWAAERVSWALIALVVLAAVIGLLGGGGPAASATLADDASGVTLEYDRFTRIQRPTSLTLHARARPGESGVPLFISNDYLRGVAVSGVTPEPEQVRAVENGLEFVFNAEPGARIAVRFELEAHRPGMHRGRAGRADRPLSFTQFSYP